MENECFLGKHFRCKRYHPKFMREVKFILKVSKQVDLENQEKIDFPVAYNEVHEGERKLDELKALEWMGIKIKYMEVEISNNSRPKMTKINDYWSEKKTTEIMDLLK